MQNKTFASIILIVMMYGCATGTSKSDAADTSLATDSSQMPASALPDSEENASKEITGRWNLVPVMASDTAAGKLPYLVFDTGHLSGNTGCNSFSGSYKSSGANLSFDEKMISTRMACPGYDEPAFVKNLLRTTGYDIKGDTLVLKFDATPLSFWLKEK